MILILAIQISQCEEVLGNGIKMSKKMLFIFGGLRNLVLVQSPNCIQATASEM